MVEREVKIRVADLNAIRPLLDGMGASRVGSEHEINRILDTPEASLQRQSQVLRLRSADSTTLTWKGPADRQDPYGHKAREELEVHITGDDADTLLTLLGRLGFAEGLRYEKWRETWRWQGVVIALDHLMFGDFVEIEGEAGVIQHALRLLRLDREPVEMRGYPELQRQAQRERG